MSLLRRFKFVTEDELNRMSKSQRDGVNEYTEARLRNLGASLIQTVGQHLQITQFGIATAIVYYHRFYAKHSFKDHDRLVVATACLFLASKVEENPKPVKHVIHAMYSYRFRKHPALKERIVKEEKTYALVKDRVLVVERSLLYTIGFDFNIEHPYKVIVNMGKMLEDYLRKWKRDRSSSKGAKAVGPEDAEGDDKLFAYLYDLHARKPNPLIQPAWNFANDSFRLTLCLQYDPHDIALSCFYLALKYVVREEGIQVTTYQKLLKAMMTYVGPRIEERRVKKRVPIDYRENFIEVQQSDRLGEGHGATAPTPTEGAGDAAKQTHERVVSERVECWVMKGDPKYADEAKRVQSVMEDRKKTFLDVSPAKVAQVTEKILDLYEVKVKAEDIKIKLEEEPAGVKREREREGGGAHNGNGQESAGSKKQKV